MVYRVVVANCDAWDVLSVWGLGKNNHKSMGWVLFLLQINEVMIQFAPWNDICIT